MAELNLESSPSTPCWGGAGPWGLRDSREHRTMCSGKAKVRSGWGARKGGTSEAGDNGRDWPQVTNVLVSTGETGYRSADNRFLLREML